MKKQRRNVSETVTRMCTLALLSALGFVLMAFAQFPNPFAPWLKIEVSEIVTLLAYALYGLPGGIFVAVTKTGLNALVHGLSAMGLGDLTALLTSCMFILGLFITSHILKWFKKGLGFRILSYAFITLLVAIVLTIANAIFITPSYLTIFSEGRLSTCFESGAIENVTSYLCSMLKIDVGEYASNVWVYIGVICVIYLPFNLLKGAICCAAYEILFNRLIFVFMKKSLFFQKYFVGNIFTKKVEEPINEENKEEKTPNEN